MNNFWEKLKKKKKPIIALAPMAGITDAPFRYMCEKYGADVLYSEMVNTTAICFDSKKTLAMLKRYKSKKPFVVQVFGNNPEHFAKAVKIIEKKIKPDGIDINFGCPAPKIIKSQSGSELFKNLKTAREVIEQTINNTSLPVSVKVRTKAGSVHLFEFLDFIEGLDIKAIMIHGRTLAQGFSGGFDDIDFGTIKKVKKRFKGVVLANGGINNQKQAKEMLKKTKADGIGVAQGCLGRPWIFKEIKKKKDFNLNIKKVLKIAYKHAKVIKKIKGKKGLIEMRKHLCWYVRGLPRAGKLRKECIKVSSLKDIKNINKINN